LIIRHHKFRHPKDSFSLIHQHIFAKNRAGFMPSRQIVTRKMDKTSTQKEHEIIEMMAAAITRMATQLPH
jgi:hypothetical protein